MSDLSFSVIDANRIVVRVHAPGPQDKEPAILQRLKASLATGPKPGMLLAATRKFPKDSLILMALFRFLSDYRVTGITGIHWSSATGHSIHIEAE